ncbi:MAG TPA: hypothetical protein VNJ08_00375 [Bacteriovoracaceae bacterium]|nr:hypothetical protein [Bacteriovoracaceae bacterium]
MINAARLLGLSVALILVLSITIKGETIFAHIYSAISPVTTTAQNAAENLFSKSYQASSNYTKKLFDNSVPKVKDSVRSGLSAPIKKGMPEEDITIHEKAELDQLIKTRR